MAMQEEIELDLQLGEAHAEIKRLQQMLAMRTEEVIQLRKTLDLIHNMSNRLVLGQPNDNPRS